VERGSLQLLSQGRHCSAPKLPDDLIRTADEVYVRLHDPKRWYRPDYSDEELADWATKIRDSGAKRAWVYFNNDFDAYAPKNAAGFRRTLQRNTKLSLKRALQKTVAV
jgi:uncharacterized protein YecE (DUF72 family)